MAAVALYLQETAPDTEPDAVPKEPVMAARPMAASTGPTTSLSPWKTAAWWPVRQGLGRGEMGRSAWRALQP